VDCGADWGGAVFCVPAENCQFLEIRGFRGRNVIGVLRILTNPETCQFLAILGIRGRSVIGALHKVGG